MTQTTQDFKGQQMIAENLPFSSKIPDPVEIGENFVVNREVDDLSKSRDNSPPTEKIFEVNREVDDSSKVCDDSPPVEKLDVVGRQVVRSDGVYIEGTIQGMKVTFTADTGAARTVISSRVFRRIPANRKPRLEKSSTLASANGQPLTEMGKAVFTIELGTLTLESELIVADIEDDALLGLDILMKGKGGPADIKMTEGVILLNGVTIPCTQVGQPEPVRKIRAAEDFLIPSRSETIVDVYVDKFDNDDFRSPQNYLLEPTDLFLEKYPVVMASCLVDISQDCTNKVRLMNPFDHEVEIHQNTVTGEAEKITSPPTILLTKENSDETENFNPVRRIKLTTEKTVTWQTNTGIIRNLSKKGTADGGKSGVVPPHLDSLYTETVENHSPAEKEAIAALLNKYAVAFSENDNDLGLTNLVEHNIDTAGAKPIKQPPRRVPIAFAEEEKKLITQMHEQGIIQKSCSPWASPLVLVLKKNGKVRPCVDYRRLNAVTIKDAFPLPRIQDCLDTVSGATLFSTFDVTSSYHQIPVKSQDIPKTAFVTKYGLFEFKTMPFGVCNGPPTCQRLMELILHGLQWQICLIYLDDIIVFSNNFNDHISRLDLVLQRISEAGLKLKPEKCQLFKPEVAFLGHVVSSHGIQPNPDNVAKILNWPTPKTVTEVRQILGMGSYYRRFIKDFSRLVKPLTELTKKANKFIWTDQCQYAFDKLKQSLVSPEIMAYPKDEGDFILDTDACETAIGGVLSQIQDGRNRVIAYGSRTLNKAECNYCITDKELLAVRHFVEYYRQYLLGRKFLVRTDHQALVWLFSLKEPKGRIARWIEILSPFDFDVEYRPGPKHGNADAMSRCKNPRDCDCPYTDNLESLKCGPCKKCKKRAQDMASTLTTPNLEENSPVQENSAPVECPEETNTAVNAVRTRNQTEAEDTWNIWKSGYSCTELKSFQEKDEDIGPLVHWKSTGTKPLQKELEIYSPATRHYCHLWDSLVLKDGILFKEFIRRDDTGHHLQFITPLKMRNEVLYQMHNSVLSGHLGRKKTKEKLSQRFYWFEMREDINIWIAKCDVCGANKPPGKTARAPLGSMPTGAPWDRIATDLLGPFPITPRGNRYILTVTDYFTKWVEVFPVPDQTAVTCARFILNDVICRYGCPISFHSDQGRSYENEVFRELCELLEIRKTRTSARNPKGNGQTERFNRTLLSMIKSFLKGEQTNWDLNLGCLAGAYRATPNESTGLTPNLLLLGREIRFPIELTNGGTPLGSHEENNRNWGEHALMIRDRLQKAHRVARKHLSSNAKRRKDYYDLKSNLISYEIFDKVWLLNESRKEGVSPKLQPLYSGPCLVTQKLNDINYEIQLNAQGNRKIVNHDKLKLYKGDLNPKWMKAVQNGRAEVRK